MKTILLSIFLCALPAFSETGAIAESPTEGNASCAIISWGIVDDRTVVEAGGKADTKSFAYYWDGEFIGYGKKAFAELYDKISRFPGARIIYRRASGEKGGYVDRIDDPFFAEETFRSFRRLLGGKRLTLEIDAKSALPPVLPEAGYNPFKDANDTQGQKMSP